MFVFMLRVAGRAACLLHILFDHGNDGVVRHTSFARAIVVQNVTKPKLALLHQSLPKEPLAGKELRKACNTSRA
jgi:hypothetical protein